MKKILLNENTRVSKLDKIENNKFPIFVYMAQFKRINTGQTQVPVIKMFGIRNLTIPSGEYWNYLICIFIENHKTKETITRYVYPKIDVYNKQSVFCQIWQLFEIQERMSISIKVQSIFDKEVPVTAYVECDFFKHY
ncbi:MAG: hypothetical protein WC150_07370 [Bacteroidia bacterium]